MIRFALALIATLLIAAPTISAADPDTVSDAEKIAVLASVPRTLDGASDFTCLAVTLYHEARGEGREGMAAVGTVVLNRVHTPGRWGDTICDVVDPTQFTYFVSNEGLRHPPVEDYDAWMMAREVATIVMVEGPDPWLMGADHYHTVDIDPSWNRGMVRVDTMKRHIFWRDPAAEALRG